MIIIVRPKFHIKAYRPCDLSTVLRQTLWDRSFRAFLCRGPAQMECIITSSHSNMRYWPIMTHLLSQTVQRTCSSMSDLRSPQMLSFSRIATQIFDQSWRIYTLSENLQKTFIWPDLLQKMYLLQRHKSPYLIITSCELPPILTPSIKVVIDKRQDFGQPRIRTFGSICLPCGVNS